MDRFLLFVRDGESKKSGDLDVKKSLDEFFDNSQVDQKENQAIKPKDGEEDNGSFKIYFAMENILKGILGTVYQ